MRALVALAVLTCACAGSGYDGGTGLTDAGTSSDGNACGAAITFDPPNPVADSLATIRASVDIVGSPGVFSYTWRVEHDNATVTHTQEASDNSQIGFIAADPGPYYVSVVVGGPTSCAYVSGTLNVEAPGANVDVYRLRTVPPTGVAPPQETVIQVRGGADYDRAISLDPGLSVTGVVRNGAGGPTVPAYVKFMPVSAPLAFTELFTSSSGSYSTRLLGQTHDVIVIPASSALAPRRLQWTATTTELVVGPGTTVSGVVRDPGGTGFGGAKVQLIANGVPSTVGTSAPDGSFSLHADYPAGASVTVKVTPPAASGLPRLEATGAFTLGSSLQIAYSAALQTCDLANVPVKRSNTNQVGVRVTVVGSLTGIAGTVTAGATVNALGSVHAGATTDSQGRMPSLLVPRSATLSAVTQLAMSDVAIDPLDTSACAVVVIDALPQQTVNGVARTAANATLAGVVVEATPVGALALGDAQVVTVTTAVNGAFTLPLAAGGSYDVRFTDPLARAARLAVPNVTSVGVPTSAVLPAALTISGKVSVTGSTAPVPGTSVQLLCAQCTGVDAARPVAQTATTSTSAYRLAVPDPGTM